MTQITKEAIKAAARIIDPEAWKAIKDGRDALPGALWGIRRDGAKRTAAAVAEFLSTLLIAVEGKVKPLTWEDQSDDVVTFHVTRDQIGMSYVVTVENLMTFVHSGSREVARFPSLAIDKAKAAAQADYGTRILSALTSSPGKDGGQEVEARKQAVALAERAGIDMDDHDMFVDDLTDTLVRFAAARSQPASTALVEAMRPHIGKLRGCVAINDAMGRVVEGQADATRSLIAAFDALAASQSTSREGESRG